MKCQFVTFSMWVRFFGMTTLKDALRLNWLTTAHVPLIWSEVKHLVDFFVEASQLGNRPLTSDSFAATLILVMQRKPLVHLSFRHSARADICKVKNCVSLAITVNRSFRSYTKHILYC